MSFHNAAGPQISFTLLSIQLVSSSFYLFIKTKLLNKQLSDFLQQISYFAFSLLTLFNCGS